MPTYEYQCEKCGEIVEVIKKKFNEYVYIICSECKSDKFKNIISKTSFSLKGDGWYQSDYKSKSKQFKITVDILKTVVIMGFQKTKLWKNQTQLKVLVKQGKKLDKKGGNQMNLQNISADFGLPTLDVIMICGVQICGVQIWGVQI